MNLFKEIIIICAFLFAITGFGWGVLKAVKYTIKEIPTKYPKMWKNIVIGVGALLATNLGSILGFSVSQARQTNQSLTDILFSLDVNVSMILQGFACIVYLIGMGYAFYGWSRVNLSEEPTKVVSVLPQLSRTLIGVVIGGASVAMGISI